MKRIVLTIILSLLLLPFAVVTSHAFSTTWTNNPANCVPNGSGDVWLGQNCYTDANCGVDTTIDPSTGLPNNVLQCKTLSEISSAPATSAASSSILSGLYSGGYLLNCLHSSGSCIEATSSFCNASTVCSGYHRNTLCTPGEYAWTLPIPSPTPTTPAPYTCAASCQSGYNDCNADGLNCEIQNGASCDTNATFLGCEAGGGNCNCLPGFYDCVADDILIPATEGCETPNGGSCDYLGYPGTLECTTTPGSCSDRNGNTRTCTCVPNAVNFAAGTNTTYTTDDPLLWGTQLGTGSLISMTNNAGGSFTVGNTGVIANTVAGSNNLLMQLNNDDGSVDFYSINSDPEGSLTAGRGSIAIDPLNGNMYLNTSATATGNTWTMLGGASGLNLNTTSPLAYDSGTSTLSINLGSGMSVDGSGNLQAGVKSSRNTAIGQYAIESMAGLPVENSAFGWGALRDIDSGYANSGFGYYSLNSIIDGSQNSALGDNSLSLNTDGSNNTGVGALSLINNITGSYNSALGYDAGVNTGDGAGQYRTAIGAESRVTVDNTIALGRTGDSTVIGGTSSNGYKLYVNGTTALNGALTQMATTAPAVSPVGTGRIYFDSTSNKFRVSENGGAFVDLLGSGTPALTASDPLEYDSGTGALSINLGSGMAVDFAGSLQAGVRDNSSTAIGINALNPLATGGANNAFGPYALYRNTSGYGNNAFGYYSLENNTIGNSNNAFGASALRVNIDGDSNNAFGYDALAANTMGDFNSAFGTNALYNNIDGDRNNAFGLQSLWSNRGGLSNNAFGSDALGENTNGSYNSAYGGYALMYNQTGSYNSALGYRAGDNFGDVAGLYRTAIGASSVVGADNTIALGRSSDSTVVGGTSALGYKLYVNGNAFTTGTWGSSDVRLKENITTIDSALMQLGLLNPVSFNWRSDEYPERNLPDGKQYGLIAQEVEQIIPELVSTDTAGYKAIEYTKLTAFLIKGLQEQQAQIEALQDLYADAGGIDTEATSFTDIEVTGLLTASAINTLSIRADESKGIDLKLGDSAGGTAFSISNYLDQKVFWVDSRGKLHINEAGQNASIGNATIKAGTDNVSVFTEAVSGNSKVFITYRNSETDLPTSTVSDVNDGRFMVKIGDKRSFDVKFDWWVVN